MARAVARDIDERLPVKWFVSSWTNRSRVGASGSRNRRVSNSLRESLHTVNSLQVGRAGIV